MLNRIIQAFAMRVERELKESLRPLPGYLRMLAAGTVALLASTIGWVGSLTFLGLSLFFKLADVPQFVVPALWTALACALIGLFLAWIGIFLLRPPR